MNETTHPLSPAQIVTTAVPDDERIWVPQAPNVWFRPLFLNTLQGQWCNLLRVRKAGVLSRHRHPAPVHGYVIKGSWRYLEHDWVAKAGDYVFEPPGETHTLTVDSADEMITFFNISGCMSGEGSVHGRARRFCARACAAGRRGGGVRYVGGGVGGFEAV
jgi:2,4'-dihydroxyacetophenone dioxygenase